MILQLLSSRQVGNLREHVIHRLRAFAEAIETGDPKALEKATKLGVTAADLREAAGVLEKEAGQEDEKGHEAAFIPSSPLTCMLQSLVEEQAYEHNFVEEDQEVQGLAGEEVPLTSLKLPPDKLDVLGFSGDDGVRGLSAGDMQEGEDIRYIVDGALGVAARLLSGKHEFNHRPARTAALGNEARVLLFGDWASGIDRARDLGRAIARVAIDDDADRLQHLIHLGDTYYAGRSWEYEKRFLPNWPATGARQVTSWSLNGNHDMYSGGKGYFVTLLQHPKFKSHRANPDDPSSASSFFLLENDHWQIFGLDSAYDSPEIQGMNGDINASQVKFLKDHIDPAKGVILLTHHQLFSARGGEGRADRIKDKLKKAKVWQYVDAWIWGHEHRCVVYRKEWTQSEHGLEFALCLGNSGVPVAHEAPFQHSSVAWEYTDHFDYTMNKKLRQFAFASLLFSGGKPGAFQVMIHNWRGEEVQTITVEKKARA